MGRKKSQNNKTLRVTIDVEMRNTHNSALEINEAVRASLGKGPEYVVTWADMKLVIMLGAVKGLSSCFHGDVLPSGLNVIDAQCHVMDVPTPGSIDRANRMLHEASPCTDPTEG